MPSSSSPALAAAITSRASLRATRLPWIAGWFVTLVGLLNLVSALTPEIGQRLRFVRGFEPTEAVLFAHALAVPAGAALIVAAYYLGKRRRRALRVAITVLAALGMLNLIKGLDFEEALICWGLAGALYWGRDAFWVHHEDATLATALRRAALLLAGALATATAAVLAASHWAMPGSGVGAALREAIALITLSHGPVDFDGIFVILPMGLTLLSIAALLATAHVLFRPLTEPHVPAVGEARRLARMLVKRHGADTLSVFKLRRDLQHLFSPDHRAFLSYRVESGVFLVSGDPVGPPDAVDEVLAHALGVAENRGLRVGVVGASESLAERWTAAGLRSFYIGDEAIVDTGEFTLEGRRIRKIRQSVTRLTKAGYTAELLTLGELEAPLLGELEAVSASWRNDKPERGFCMAMDSLEGEHLADSRVLIARDEYQRVRGFLHFTPAYGRPAASLGFMRREHDTPNGLTEFMVVRSIAELREVGVEEISLNFAAFARLMRAPESLWERFLGRVAKVFNPYFQIESLYSFNAKFFPTWQPRYLLYEGALGMPRVSVAALVAEGQIPAPPRINELPGMGIAA